MSFYAVYPLFLAPTKQFSLLQPTHWCYMSLNLTIALIYIVFNTLLVHTSTLRCSASIPSKRRGTGWLFQPINTTHLISICLRYKRKIIVRCSQSTQSATSQQFQPTTHNIDINRKIRFFFCSCDVIAKCQMQPIHTNAMS